MSYRSSLANPSTSSGNVGQIISATQSETVSLVTGVVSNIASITLPSGVWSISQCYHLQIANTTVLTSGFVYLYDTASLSNSVQSTVAYEPLTASGTFTSQRFSETTLVLTAETVLTLGIGLNFSEAAITALVPYGFGPLYTLKATKLA
jgi:hypothetical protein